MRSRKLENIKEKIEKIMHNRQAQILEHQEDRSEYRQDKRNWESLKEYIQHLPSDFRQVLDTAKQKNKLEKVLFNSRNVLKVEFKPYEPDTVTEYKIDLIVDYDQRSQQITDAKYYVYDYNHSRMLIRDLNRGDNKD